MRKFTIRSDDGKYVKLISPLKVYYDITTRCNLDCIFCFKDEEKTDVTIEQAKKIIKKVANANIPDIVFIGGEPMCCDFLFDALSYSKELGLNPGFITNGTHFTKENVKKIKTLVNNSVSISIHAPNDEMHDKISSGHKVYSKIIEGLKLLNSADVIPEIAFTPTKYNMNVLFETIDGVLKENIKISDVLVNRLIPYGNALKNYCDKSIELKEQITLFEQMDKIKQKYPNLTITTGDAIPFCMVEEKYRKYISRCDYAITLGWINDKNLFGKCMVRGSDSRDSLDQNDIKDLWQKSNVFLTHRCMKNLQDVCVDCEWIIECGGGCACSGMGEAIVDSYFNKEKMLKMPHNGNKYECEITVTNDDVASILDDSIYVMKYDVFMRKEIPVGGFDRYLLIPASKGAVIQDIIESENGEMLWINENERSIIHYLQLHKSVHNMIKYVSYECNMSFDETQKVVKETIAKLIKIGMVEKIMQ